MKKKASSIKNSKAVSNNGSREFKPFEVGDYAKSRGSSRVSEATDKKSRVNPFRAADISIGDDSVAFEYEEAVEEASAVNPEESVSPQVTEDADSNKCAPTARDEKSDDAAEPSVFAEAADAEIKTEAPARPSSKREKNETTPEERELNARKIWIIESALAILASFLALIVASIY